MSFILNNVEFKLCYYKVVKGNGAELNVKFGFSSSNETCERRYINVVGFEIIWGKKKLIALNYTH